MWALILAIIVIILAIVNLLIIFSLQFKLRVDLNNLSVCFKIYILDSVEVFSFNFFVCEEKFYYQINRKNIKMLILSGNEENNKPKSKKKVDRLQRFNYLINSIPKIKFKKLHIDYAIKFDDLMKDSVFGGAVIAFAEAVANGSSKLEIEDFAIENVTAKESFRGMRLNCKLGLAVFSILAYGIKVIFSKRKFAVKI